jgi:hypothetical protein
VWYDELNLGFGALQDEIERQMYARPIFIVALSPSAVASDWVKRETNAAIYLLDQQRQQADQATGDDRPVRVVLPVVAQTCAVPLLWSGFKRVSGADDTGLLAPEAARRIATALNFPPPTTLPSAPPPQEAPTTPAQTPSAEQSPPREDAHVGAPQRSLFSHAVTDLFDERGKPVIHLAPWLVVVLTVWGFIAVILAGFAGFEPWSPYGERLTLFLWLCALVAVAQAQLLRSPLLRRQLVLTLATLGGCIFIVGSSSFVRLLPEELQRVLTLGGRQAELLDEPWVYTAVNVGALAVFWWTVLWDWVGRARISQPEGQERIHSALGRAARDFAGAAALAFVLAALFSPKIGLIPGVSFNACTVSWPLGVCAPPGGGPTDPPTWSVIDTVQGIAYAVPALLFLLLLLVTGGLGKLGSVGPFASGGGWLQRAAAFISPGLRRVLWPGLIFIAIYGLDKVAFSIQRYLSLSSAPSLSDSRYVLELLLIAGFWAAVAVGGITLAVMLHYTDWSLGLQAGRYLLRLAGQSALVFALGYWIVALILALVNLLLLPDLLKVTERTPFYPPGWSAVISFVFFCAYLLWRGLQQRRSRGVAPAR